MSKLHKKCVVASTGMHLLLLLVLLVGPAFLMRSDKAHDMPVLEFIPDILVDEQVQGGGNPNLKAPPPVAPPRPERQPVTVKPDPQPLTAKPDPQPKAKDPEPQPVETPKWKPSEKIKISPNKTIRNADQPTKARITSPDSSKVFADAAKSIRAAASSTTIEMPSLGAGSGPAYANYAQAVKSIYERNWYPPDDTSRDDALVKVQVVIAKDGAVVSAKITSRCGDAAIDGTVDATLRRVTSVPPFPAGAKEGTRTYIIGFNLKAKRAL
jgi:protein TonB